MVERRSRRRKPLVLSSTKALVDLMFDSRKTAEVTDGIDEITFRPAAPLRQLMAGIPRFAKETAIDSADGSVLVGLCTSVLKKLSITYGSLIMIKNVDANLSRIGQTVVLFNSYA